jgi:uncharacterized protein YjbI with pentapeptide repeats
MANESHVKILEQGTKFWNEWRKTAGDILPDLTAADFREKMLIDVNFIQANLQGANFAGATLRKSSFTLAKACDVNFTAADLRECWFAAADVSRAKFFRADLNGAILKDAIFNQAILGYTTLVNADLTRIKGLETIVHNGPSHISIETLYRCGKDIPEEFLYEAGIPAAFIASLKSFMTTMDPIQFYSCFISYSSKDQAFAAQLHADLQSKGVRCWYAPEDLRIGDKLRSSLDDAIRLYDKLMVILSEHSVESQWVEKEVETAFEKEHKQSRPVLFPIRLDNAVMDTNEAWAADIRRTRHIGDFCNWKNQGSYKKALERLLRDLKEEGKSDSVSNRGT